MSRSVPAARGEPELFMECHEEELTASQKLADIQAQRKYKTALKNITDAGKSVHSPGAQKIPIRRAPFGAKRHGSSDVIIIDDPSTNIPAASPAAKQVKQYNNSAVKKTVKGASANSASSTASSYQSTSSFNPSSLHFASLSGFPSLQSTASSATNLILASSNMSNLQVPQSLPAGMIIPAANVVPYLTLPASIQPSYLPMGKKLLLAVPVLTTSQPNFVLSTGVNQLRMLNNTNASLTAIPQALGGAMPTELGMFGNNVYLQSGQLPSASTSVKEMLLNRILSPTKPVVKSELTQNTDGAVNRLPRRGRGRPRKVLASPHSCTDDEVVDDQKLELPQRTGSAIIQRPSRQSKILSAILTGTRDKIKGDVDHEDVQLVAPFEVTECVKPNNICERKSLRNSEKSLVTSVRAFGIRSNVEKPLASPFKASNARYTGIKRSAKAEKQAELVSKRPKLVMSLFRRRRRKRVSRLSWCKRRRQTPQSFDQKSNQSGSSEYNPQGEAPQISSQLTAQRKEENAVTEEALSSTSIPSDEYYYGKKDGDHSYREEKGEYRFKCWSCHKMLYNNLRLMQHVQTHVENEKQQILDLHDLAQCKHCYRQFDTPFEMQCHSEKVHQNNSKALVCRICEKVHRSIASLHQHMNLFHSTCEMPYACALCGFRSSHYSDVIDHFKKCHDSSQYVLCLYCLKTFRIPFYKLFGCGMTKCFFRHIQRHQSKCNDKKCSSCKLTFLNRADADRHQASDHLPNYQGTQNSAVAVDSSIEQVLIGLKESGVRLLNAPEMSKPDTERALRYNGVGSNHKCVECKKPMGSSLHYKNYAECTLCRFATSCSDAFSTHMMKRHSGVAGKRKTLTRKGVKMKSKMFCLCGFSSMNGTILANHLVLCSKRTCYSSKPKAGHFKRYAAQEESTSFEPFVKDLNSKILGQETSVPDADVPSLFGALGLVKRQRRCDRQQSKTPGPRSRLRISSEVIVSGIMEDLLDSLFPAEVAASHAIDRLLGRTMITVGVRAGRQRKKLALLKRIDQLKNSRFTKATGVSAEAVGVAGVTMATDLPMESAEKAEPFAKRERSTKSHSKEAVDIFWNMPTIEKMETVAELAGLNAKKETCYDETDLETGHDVKFNIVKVKLETDKEDLESSDALDATKNLSIDDSSCAISDEFLITTNDDSTEINDDDDDDDDDNELGETAISTDNAIDYEHCSSDCVVDEAQRSPIVTFDDISNVDYGNGVCHGEMDTANSGKNNDDTVNEPHDECDDLHLESLTDDLKFFDSVQRDDITKLVVIQQQEEEENAVELSDNTELEAIHHSGGGEESHSLNKNSCDLEDVKVNNETLDSFAVEPNAGERNKISNQGPSDWHGSSEHSQNIIEDYATTPVVSTEDPIDAGDNAQNNQQNIEYQSSVGDGDVDHRLSSMVGKEHDNEGSEGNEDPDTPCTIGSCVHKDDHADHDVHTDENFETGQKFGQESTNNVSDVLQPVGRFRGKEPAEIGEDKTTSLCPLNLEGQFDAGTDDKDMESSLECVNNKTISLPAINLENQDIIVSDEDKDVEATEIDEDRTTSLCPLNLECQFDAGTDDKDMESSLDCVNNKTISLPAIDLENQDVIVSDEDKDVEGRLNSQLSEVACNEDNAKIVDFNDSGTLGKGASEEIPILGDAAAEETRHSETKAGEQKLPDLCGLHDQRESLSAEERQSHTSRHHGSSAHRESHKPGSSHYKDQGQRGRYEQRESRNYEQRRFEKRDHDRRDYDRRDYDRRDEDQRSHDQRDYYHRLDHGSTNRSESHGRNKDESYGHGYRHERGDRYYDDRPNYFSRREQSRNSDSDRNRNSSNSRRNYYC